MAYFKKIFIVFLIIFLLFFNSFSYATTTVYDVLDYLELRYHADMDNLIDIEIAYYKKHGEFTSGFKGFATQTLHGHEYMLCTYVMSYETQRIMSNITSGKFWFTISGSSPASSVIQNNRMVYFASVNKASPYVNGQGYLVDNSGTGDLGYFAVTNYTYDSTARGVGYYNGVFYQESKNVTVSIPTQLINCSLTDFERDFLTSVAEDTFSLDSEKDILQKLLDEQKKTNDKLDDVYDFLTSTDSQEITSQDMPQNIVQDITSQGFNNIFNTLQDAFLDFESNSYTFTIPFINYSFTVDFNSTENILRSNSNLLLLLNFIHLLWWYKISKYIILDVYKYINDFKNGNVNKSETLITTEML